MNRGFTSQDLVISSPSNPRIKSAIRIQKESRFRRHEGSFGVEGLREIKKAVENGFQIKNFYYCSELLTVDEFAYLNELRTRCPARPYRCEIQAFTKLVIRKNYGLFVEFVAPKLTLKDLILKKNPVIVVLDGIEKPGNIGAILRSADATGTDAVMVASDNADLYNPHAIRSSLGAIFSVPILSAHEGAIYNFLLTKKIQLLGAIVQDQSNPYYKADLKRGVGIVMGSEAEGLNDFWREKVDQPIKIPMIGQMDSLNVSVAASVLLFEALRQRNVN